MLGVRVVEARGGRVDSMTLVEARRQSVDRVREQTEQAYGG
ncbi:MAG: hypothetical protein R3B49_10225 [Phycisphaerales bacterium]